jgi:hypothetical protein
MDADEKGPYILHSEVKKAIKEMRDKKATGDDDVLGDVLKLLGEDGLNIMMQLTNKMYGTGEWPKDFIEVTTVTLKKKPKATNCSTIAHTAKIVVRIFRRRIEGKIKDICGEDQFGLRKGKVTTNAIGMLRIILE